MAAGGAPRDEAKGSLMGSKRQTVFEVCVSLAKALRSAREQFEALDLAQCDGVEESEALVEELRKNMQVTEENLLDFATCVLDDSGYGLSEPSGTGKYDVN